MNKICWLDLETTGLDPVKNGIIQAAFIIEIDGEVKEKREFNMNPIGKVLDPQAMAIHGLSEADLGGFPTSLQVKKDIERFFSEFVEKFDKTDKFTVAGYNVDFDLGFLENLWLESGDKFFFSWVKHFPIDVFKVHPFMEWAGIATAPERRNLETLAKHYGIEFPNAHNALADIEMTRELALKLREKVRVAQ
ncbi:MAG: exonuclease domain-containing protein [Rectinemataceae bacterium]